MYKKKKATDMLRAKRLLAEIISFINEDTESSHRLWSILTSLRGPDNMDKKLKSVTTARIRGRIGLKSYMFDISNEPLVSSSVVATDYLNNVDIYHFF
jgi:hypothetical protein